MNRTEKQTMVKDLAEKIQKTKSFLLADYCGLTVAQMTDLRRKLHGSKSKVSVIKNRLFKRALKELSIEGLDEYLKGPIALASSDEDEVMPAKVMVAFAKDNEKLKLKAGLMGSKVLSLAMIKDLASLPSREVLLAKMLGSMNAPATNLVGVLSALPRQLVTVINAIKDKKQ